MLLVLNSQCILTILIVLNLKFKKVHVDGRKSYPFYLFNLFVKMILVIDSQTATKIVCKMISTHKTNGRITYATETYQSYIFIPKQL